MKSKILLLVLSLISSPAFASRLEPHKQIDTFFRVLDEKGGAAAIDDLCKGTLLESQKKPELAAGAPQLDAVFKIYGKMARAENVDEKNFGESFLRVRMISYHGSGAPLFWEFMFFKAKGEWQVYTFRFNDQFDRIFPSA